jgi:hypothetical protein
MVSDLRARLGAWLGLAALVGGCAAPTPPLYDWGIYPAATYQYLRGDGFDLRTSISQLEDQLQKTMAAKRNPPPGLHGHLALLYAKAGDDANAQGHLQKERERFPESAAYVDFLIKNATQSATQSGAGKDPR